MDTAILQARPEAPRRWSGPSLARTFSVAGCREPRGPADPGRLLEEVALPVLLDVRRRLLGAGHRAEVQVLTGLEPARLRFLYWPPPRTPAAQDALRHTLEFEEDLSVPGAFSARHVASDGPDRTHDRPPEDGRAVDAAWFENRCLDFLEGVLSTP